MSPRPKMLAWPDFPPDFVVWKLNPTGCELTAKELAPGVYALLSSIPGVDNVGFVVGKKGVLVIDAHISVAMARQIQERIREVTDKPLLYLVNSNYHADHVFGNCAFPRETVLIQHRETAARTPYFKEEREFMLPAVANDPAIFEGAAYRAPDLVFGDRLAIDLGGIAAEVHWFGAANTPGDTVTYVPSARAAWVGNMTTGTFGLCLESDAPTYMATVARLMEALVIDTVVPAHAPIHGPEAFGDNLRYFGNLATRVKRALQEGWSLEETMRRTPLDDTYRLPDADPRAVFIQGRHSYNVRRTYNSLAGR
ncbi:MAG: MBL fold metallo-hydrolase [Candidatus Tectomicrobia bacterium]|uniref:MBL fold metallo-hydrolase n=1 Tax=Tectimicrobiota bacterium TaxID=2528274 RepID=A0A933E9G9_UNCTE|nr:MBL fold metallo-hydrolase [Candidatus Tectomicrobia bacterium]